MGWKIFGYFAPRHRIALLVEISLIIVVIVFTILDVALQQSFVRICSVFVEVIIFNYFVYLRCII